MPCTGCSSDLRDGSPAVDPEVSRVEAVGAQLGHHVGDDAVCERVEAGVWDVEALIDDARSWNRPEAGSGSGLKSGPGSE